MRWFYFFSVCILASGCSNFGSNNTNWPAQLNFQGFTSSQQSQVEAMIDDLNSRAGVQMINYNNPNSSNYPIYLSIKSTDPSSLTTSEAGYTVEGPQNCTVWIADFLFESQYSPFLETVVAHELDGHCAQQVHTQTPGQIMNPVASAFTSYQPSAFQTFFNTTLRNVNVSGSGS